MKNYLFALALAITPTLSVAQDKTSPLVIAGGVDGGGYNKFAKNLAERMKQRGYTSVSVSVNNGSDAITLAACNSAADVWISQIDAIYTRYNEGCVLTPVADYGVEHALLLVPPRSDIDELSDLSAEHVLAVDGIGSGTELFWNTIKAIELGDDGNKNPWAKARTVESSAAELNTMANFGTIHAAILVRKTDSADIQLLLNQGWSVAELWDKDIDDQYFNNLPLYASGKVTIKTPSGKYTAWGYEVKSFVGVSPTLADNRTLKSDIASAVQK